MNQSAERFLFVVTPDDDERDELSTWEGSINQINKNFDKRTSLLQTSVEKRLNDITEQVEQFSRRDMAQDKDLKQCINLMNKLVVEKVAQVRDRQSAFQEKFDYRLAALEQKSEIQTGKIGRILEILEKNQSLN